MQHDQSTIRIECIGQSTTVNISHDPTPERYFGQHMIRTSRSQLLVQAAFPELVRLFKLTNEELREVVLGHMQRAAAQDVTVVVEDTYATQPRVRGKTERII